MTTLKNLERQHHDIYEVLNNTKEMINGSDLEANSMTIAKNISILAGKLKIHLNNEDKYLYPALLNKGNQALQRKTEKYHAEMGHLSETYMQFKDKYNTRSKILAAPSNFVKEANEVFEAVFDRMHREDTDLYVQAKDYVH